MGEIRDDVPEELERLVRQLLAKRPEQRPADAYEVYHGLLPLLPVPGSPPPAALGHLAGMPDPTLLYRLPNALRPRPAAAPPVPEPEPAGAATAAATGAEAEATSAREVIRVAVMQSDSLLAHERFAQAAEVLHNAVGPAAAVLGEENQRVLRLPARGARRSWSSLESSRTALPEFDALVAAYTRTAGPTSPEALDCLRQAAHCRAEFGQTTAALQQFQQVLGHVGAADGYASPNALDLRRNIGHPHALRGQAG